MKHIKEYDMELLKQTEPYLYFLQKQTNEERGKSMDVDGPLPCVINIKGIETAAYECNVGADTITYVMLKTPEACLYSDGIYRMIEAGIENNKKLIPDLIYSDHDYMTEEGVRHTPYFKPDYSPHTLLGTNYMGKLVQVRKEVLLDVLSAVNTDDFDVSGEMALWALLLKISRVCESITHVTQTLWYMVCNDASEKIYSDYESCYLTPAACRIREEAMAVCGIVQHDNLSLSVIIPSKDHSDILIRCLESLKVKAGFNHFKEHEIIIIDNGSYLTERQKLEEYFAGVSELNVRYIYEPAEFNYAAMCNRGAQESSGDLLLFMNDDIEAVSDSLACKMAMYAASDSVGAVGAKLLYPNGNIIQHIGVTSLSCGPTHKLATYDDGNTYYFGVNRFTRNYLALTGACLMVEREKYFQVKGFHDKMTVSYNDVDLCANLSENGLFNVVLNDVVLTHYESLSRGSDLVSDEKYARLKQERDLFYERHPHLLEGCDPFYNCNLIQDTLDYCPNVMPDYLIRDELSTVEVLLCKGLNKSLLDRLKFAIEKTSVCPSFSDRSIRFVEMEGWSLYLKHDDRIYRRYILFIPEGDNKAIRVSLMPRLRRDVSEVYADEKNTLLAGFVLRIPEAVLDAGRKYRVAVMYEHRVLHYKVISYGEYYEPGVGYGKDQ